MKIRVLLPIVAIAAVAVWLYRRGRVPAGTIKASTPRGLRPVNVVLPEVDLTTEERTDRHRHEQHELRRITVHGPYRPIEDAGPPTSVKLGSQA